MGLKRVTLTVDEDYWEAARPVLKEAGWTMSRYVDLMIREVVVAAQGNLQGAIEHYTESLFSRGKAMIKKRKR